MIERPTALILGAGSSVHCCYPLGAQLITQLCRKRPWQRDTRLPNGWSADDVDRLINRLSRSGYYSIDAFLEKHKEHSELGKYLIAAELKACEVIGQLFPPNNSGWYQYLFNRLLVNDRPDFEQNRIGIITFNYDRSLEAYLHNVLMNRFDLSPVAASERMSQIPIIHVHGILGEFPDTPYDSQSDEDGLVRISQSIKIIHEIADQASGFCNQAFSAANEILSRSERIYFLGFGFHRDNLRRFQYFTSKTAREKTFLSTNYGLGEVDYQRMERDLAEFGIHRKMFSHAGTDCEQFFRNTGSLD